MLKLAGYCVISLLIFFLAVVFGSGADYIYHYRPHVSLWLDGQAQFYVSQLPGFYNPPWLVWLLTPLMLFPPDGGLALLQLITAFSLVFALDTVTRNLAGYTKLFSMIFGLVNFIVFDLLNRGQIDAFPLLGALICLSARRTWVTSGLGYTLLSLKPPNTLPLIIYFFVRDWLTKSFKEAAKGLIIPVGVLALSFGLHGWWPGPLLTLITGSPPYDTWRTTIWRAADVLQLNLVVPVVFCLVVLGAAVWLWRYAQTQTKQVALIVLTTFLVTPYALSYHYILVLALVMPFLMAWKLWVGIGLYLLTFLPIVRLFIGVQHSYLDLLFILAGFVAMSFWLVSTRQTPTADLETTPVERSPGLELAPP